MRSLPKDVIPFQPDIAWNMLADVAKWPEWMEIEEVLAPPQISELKEGMLFECKNVMGSSSVNIVLAEPPHLLTYLVLPPMFHNVGVDPIYWTWSFEPTDAGSIVKAKRKPIMETKQLILGGFFALIFDTHSGPTKNALVEYARSSSPVE